jgi:ribosomal protein L29
MEFKTASSDELQKFISDKQGELRSLHFSSAGSKNRNVKLSGALRKDIARAMTALTASQKIENKK